MEDDKKTWEDLKDAVLSGVLPDHEGNLLPEDTPLADKIILLELARETAIASGLDLSTLETRKDFAEWVADRRPDPTWNQWLWLYWKIGPKRHECPVDKVVGIMAGRDALLPFLRSAPDLRLAGCYEKFFEGDAEDEQADELPYPQLEDAIKSDAPAKLSVLRLICRGVTDEQLMDRAVTLGKPAVACSLLKSFPSEQRIPKLAKILRHWEKPEELIGKAVAAFGDELVSWHDDYGNGFFWYLYAHEKPVFPAVISAIPETIIAATFERPNRYGIAPSDLWSFYREGLVLPEC